MALHLHSAKFSVFGLRTEADDLEVARRDQTCCPRATERDQHIYIRVHKRDVQRIMETEIEWNIEIETWLQRRPSKSDTFDCGWISNYKHTFAEDVFPRLLTESLHGCDVGVFDPWIAMRFEFSLCFRIFDLSRQWMLPLQRPQNAKDTVSKVMFKDHENSCTSGTKHKGTQPSRSASLSCCLLWNRSLKDPGTK